MSSPFSLGTKILGGGAGVLIGLLVLGLLLPATWEAEASAVVDVNPETAFEYLDSPARWRAWTVWPDSGVEMRGPARGAGAGLTWDDRGLGSGAFTIVEARRPTFVTYRVEVASGRMVTEGRLELVREGDGTRIRWRETGDLGRNPLMGYWALSMDRAQSEELAKSLERLGAVLAGATGSEPSR